MPAYSHGLVIGKFYPPTLGHHALIRFAAARAERVSVVVMCAARETLALSDRVAWLRAEHADSNGVAVVGIPCDIPVDFADPCIWTAQVRLMRAAVATVTDVPVDTVFSSEPYGDDLAARLGAVHIPFDPGRTLVRVSSSAVRADLAAHWRLLSRPVRRGLAVRIVVVGAESTGTTTIARLLAEQYQGRGGPWADTRVAPEYGREYTVTKWERAKVMARAAGRPELPLDALVWDTTDFDAVATEQTAREEAAAAAGSPLLVCDTDALATAVWERRYLGRVARVGQSWAGPALPRRDLYLLTDHHGVPWEDDGLREGDLAMRAAMTGWFATALTDAGQSWALLTGSLKQRLALAIGCTEAVLSARHTFTPPLG